MQNSLIDCSSCVFSGCRLAHLFLFILLFRYTFYSFKITRIHRHLFGSIILGTRKFIKLNNQVRKFLRFAIVQSLYSLDIRQFVIRSQQKNVHIYIHVYIFTTIKWRKTKKSWMSNERSSYIFKMLGRSKSAINKLNLVTLTYTHTQNTTQIWWEQQRQFIESARNNFTFCPKTE